jgi:hypothetical protein
LNAAIEIVYPTNTDTLNGSAASAITYNQGGTGAQDRTVEAKLQETVSVKDFGAVGDGVTDDTAAIQAALDYVFASTKSLHIPAGTYLYSSLDAILTENITIIGDGSNMTILKFTGSGIALDFGSSSGFRQGINIKGFTVEGNTNTTFLIRATCLSRCIWDDINVREAETAAGVGFLFRACMLSQFNFLQCSQDRNAMVSPPYEAVQIEALSPYGNSSNNTFTNLYAEGAGASEPSIDIGIRISGGDQNTFIGGSPESCKTYGLLVGSGCRFNTFIGVGFENLNSTADASDAGIQNRYINCYASQSFIIQGRSIVVQGGHFERIQIDAGASRTRIQDLTVNNWATGSGGFVDNGTASFYSNIYDQDLAEFIYIRKDRASITVGSSPTTWENDTGQFVEVVAQTGTLTQVRIIRGTDSWIVNTSTPNSYLLGPSDSIEFSYSVAPTLSYVPHNGFQG